jgi:hypothetical protein
MTIENNAKFVDFQSECEDSTRLGGIESFGVVDVKTMRRQCKCNARAVCMAASSVSTVRAIRGPQKCFPNLASFRQVDAESEIAFSKKDETFQESQGILSPLRLPVPPRPPH